MSTDQSFGHFCLKRFPLVWFDVFYDVNDGLVILAFSREFAYDFLDIVLETFYELLWFVLFGQIVVFYPSGEGTTIR